MQSPPIDPRDRAALAARTTGLAEQFSGWSPAPDRSDLGSALAGVFARFAELIVERLNQAPDRGYLAFLNLIGTQPLPPQPAQVPLSFTLAEGGTTSVLVPSGTQVSAPATQSQPEETVFETAEPIVISTAQLRSVIVSDPTTGLYSDRSSAGGTLGEPFSLFTGDRTPPHELFIACPLFGDEGTRELELRMSVRFVQQWDPGVTRWAYWDGEAWQPIAATVTTGNLFVSVRFAQPPPIPESQVNGVTGHWLRAQSTLPIPTAISGVSPQAVASGRGAVQPMSQGFAPFGDTGQAKFCYFALEPPKGTGTTVRLFFEPRDATVWTPEVGITWSYRAARGWQQLGRAVPMAPTDPASGFAFTETTGGFTHGGSLSFTVPPDWAPAAFNGFDGHWLRAELADGATYQQAPLLDSVIVQYELPIGGISSLQIVQRGTAEASIPVPAAVLNDTALDVSKDFQPFGEAPAYGDTLYLACPPAATRPEAPVTLTVTLANSAGKRTVLPIVTDAPEIRWETYDGTAWRPALVSRPDVFTTDGDLIISLPTPLVPSMAGGQEALWVRARMTGSGYGKPAGYKPDPKGGYVPVDATLKPPMVSALTWRPVAEMMSPPSACVTYNDFRYTNSWRGPTRAQFTPFMPFEAGTEPDPALYLGFDRPFGPSPVTLFLPLEAPLPEEMAADRLADLDPASGPRLVWEYSGPSGWSPLIVVDGTGGLSGRGTVQFLGPEDITGRKLFGDTAFWVRLRLAEGEFIVDPRASGILPNTTWATQVSTVTGEILGSGTGEPGQVFVTAQTPVLPGQRLLVREAAELAGRELDQLRAAAGDDAVIVTADESGAPGQVWVRWDPVNDFYGSGPLDRHYTIDPLTGQICFGDGHSGLLPARGQGNLQITYRTGGGRAGNRGTGEVTELKTALPSVDAVVNRQPAQGGAAQESIARLTERGPQALRHRDRALTAQDLEDLALDVSAEVVRVKAVPAGGYDPYDLWLDPERPVLLPQHSAAAAGRAGVIIVPDSPAERPTPSLGLLRQVRDHLLARCSATADVWVSGPEWIGVIVTATVVPVAGEVADTVEARVRARIASYLHPVTGGRDGRGWAFGRKPHRSEMFSLAESVRGVDHVLTLQVVLHPESDTLRDRLTEALNRPLTASGRLPASADLQRWLDRALVYSGAHDITTNW